MTNINKPETAQQCSLFNCMEQELLRHPRAMPAGRHGAGMTDAIDTYTACDCKKVLSQSDGILLLGLFSGSMDVKRPLVYDINEAERFQIMSTEANRLMDLLESGEMVSVDLKRLALKLCSEALTLENRVRMAEVKLGDFSYFVDFAEYMKLSASMYEASARAYDMLNSSSEVKNVIERQLNTIEAIKEKARELGVMHDFDSAVRYTTEYIKGMAKVHAAAQRFGVSFLTEKAFKDAASVANAMAFDLLSREYNDIRYFIDKVVIAKDESKAEWIPGHTYRELADGILSTSGLSVSEEVANAKGRNSLAMREYVEMRERLDPFATKIIFTPKGEAVFYYEAIDAKAGPHYFPYYYLTYEKDALREFNKPIVEMTLPATNYHLYQTIRVWLDLLRFQWSAGVVPLERMKATLKKISEIAASMEWNGGSKSGWEDIKTEAQYRLGQVDRVAQEPLKIDKIDEMPLDIKRGTAPARFLIAEAKKVLDRIDNILSTGVSLPKLAQELEKEADAHYSEEKYEKLRVMSDQRRIWKDLTKIYWAMGEPRKRDIALYKYLKSVNEHFGVTTMDQAHYLDVDNNILNEALATANDQSVVTSPQVQEELNKLRELRKVFPRYTEKMPSADIPQVDASNGTSELRQRANLLGRQGRKFSSALLNSIVDLRMASVFSTKGHYSLAADLLIGIRDTADKWGPNFSEGFRRDLTRMFYGVVTEWFHETDILYRIDGMTNEEADLRFEQIAEKARAFGWKEGEKRIREAMNSHRTDGAVDELKLPEVPSLKMRKGLMKRLLERLGKPRGPVTKI